MKAYRAAATAPWCEVQERADGVHLRFGCGDEVAFALRLEALKEDIPSHARRWHADQKTWWVAEAYRYELNQWRVRWFENGRHTTPPPSAPYQAHQAPWAWVPPGSGAHGAYAALHLLPTAPPALVKAAYRTLATLHHPDRGCDTATMAQLNAAYAELEKGVAV